MIQVNFSIDIMENGKWRIENERKDTDILQGGVPHPAVCKSLAITVTVGATFCGRPRIH